MDRKRFEWDVVLMDPSRDGATSEERFSAYWSPKREFVTNEFIAASAAAEFGRQRGKVLVGVSATLVEA